MHKRLLLTRILPISALLMVVILKFQNCAPMPQNMAISGPDSEVRISDRWQALDVAFVNEQESVPVSQTIHEIRGLCVGSTQNETIHWELVESSAEATLVAEGSVRCSYGNFVVTLQDNDLHDCSKTYIMRAIRSSDLSNAIDDKIATTQVQLSCDS